MQINLISDTTTKPTQGMLEAMMAAAAEMGLAPGKVGVEPEEKPSFLSRIFGS